MIRFFVGLLILAGVAGTEDYAQAAGTASPPFLDIIFWSVVGVTLMLLGVSKMIEVSEKNS